MRSQSGCFANPLNAKITFILSFRNDGTEAGSPGDVIPVRRYSDGTTNDSIIDTMSFDDVKPGRTIRFNGDFDYNAEDHRLLECWAQFTDSGKRVPIRVVAS